MPKRQPHLPDEPPTRARPALFRALGNSDAPKNILVDEVIYHRAQEFKHDSWAATALYASDDGQRIVCKFNRTQSVFGMPLFFVGWFLANRERKMFRRLGDLPNVPCGCGNVYANGKFVRTASAHEFVDGTTLRLESDVNQTFFDELDAVLNQLHARNVAYVDLHKCENVIVGKNDRPYLIDFQISVYLPPIWPLSALLRVLQQSDNYHAAKMKMRVLAGTAAAGSKDLAKLRPWWIRAHRIIGVPFRQARRKMFVLLGVRKKCGSAMTEQNPEDGLRPINGSPNQKSARKKTAA